MTDEQTQRIPVDMQAEFAKNKNVVMRLLETSPFTLEILIALNSDVRAALFDIVNASFIMHAMSKKDDPLSSRSMLRILNMSPVKAKETITNINRAILIATAAKMSLDNFIAKLDTLDDKLSVKLLSNYEPLADLLKKTKVPLDNILAMFPDSRRDQLLDNILAVLRLLEKSKQPNLSPLTIDQLFNFQFHQLVIENIFQNLNQVLLLNSQGIATLDIMRLDAHKRHLVLSNNKSDKSIAIINSLKEKVAADFAAAHPPRSRRSCAIS